MSFALTFQCLLCYTSLISLFIANLFKIMSPMFEPFCKLFETSIFLRTWKIDFSALISSFSWVLLFPLRVFMLMSPRPMLLRLGHNQPTCNKCVAFLALRVSIVALWKILAPLLRLCMLSARRMRLLFGDHPKIPHSMSLRICLLMLPCLLYPTSTNILKFIAMLVIMG